MQRLPPVIAALFAAAAAGRSGRRLEAGCRAADDAMGEGRVARKRPCPSIRGRRWCGKDWLNLNGLWDMPSDARQGRRNTDQDPRAVSHRIGVVGRDEARRPHDSIAARFEIPQAWSGRHVLLHFGAVDWEAKVSVNGKELGGHRGGYDDFSL